MQAKQVEMSRPNHLAEGLAGSSGVCWHRSMPSQGALAAADITEGARLWYIWGLLGWQDIRQRYRRSRIGPFWLTISMGVLIGSMGALYAGLFGMRVSEYLPYLALGFITWGLVSGLITEGCSAFITSDAIIKQVRLPFSVYAYRVVCRNVIIFGHNIAIFFVVAIAFSIWPSWSWLLALIGLGLLCLNGAWVGLLLGLVSARFRDLPQIMASIVQVTFFLTPIIWKPTTLHGHAWLIDLNPFYHFVALVRMPLLGGVPGVVSWLTVLGITLLGWAVTFGMYRSYRRRIAYWV